MKGTVLREKKNIVLYILIGTYIFQTTQVKDMSMGALFENTPKKRKTSLLCADRYRRLVDIQRRAQNSRPSEKPAEEASNPA